MLWVFSDNRSHPGLHEVTQFLYSLIPIAILCRIHSLGKVPVVGAFLLNGIDRHYQGITYECYRGWCGFGRRRHAEDIAEQVVFLVSTHVDDHADDGLALFQFINKHVKCARWWQDDGTTAVPDIVHYSFKLRIFADISHGVKLSAHNLLHMAENLPVPDVAREHHETPSACQRLIYVLLPLHHNPASDLFIAHKCIPDRVYNYFCLVHEYLQHKPPRILYAKGGAYLDCGNLPMERVYEPHDDANKSKKIHHEVIGQASDEPDHSA